MFPLSLARNTSHETLSVAWGEYAATQYETTKYSMQIHTYALSDCRVESQVAGVESVPARYWTLEHLYRNDLWCLRWLQGLCRVDREFYLHFSEQTECYIHFLSLVKLAWNRNGTTLSLKKQSRILRTQSQKSLLIKLYQPYPPGLEKILKKFGAIPLSKQYYQLLVKFMRDNQARNFLAHTKKLRAYHLRWIDDFPKDLLDVKILHSIKNATDYQDFRSMAVVLLALHKQGRHDNELNKLEQLKTCGQLRNWYKQFFLRLDFPPPPWPGNQDIKPITTPNQLKALVYEFRNCAYDYIRTILTGQHYMYHCCRGPVMILLTKDSLLGWRINEINGPKNETPEADIIAMIKAVFEQANLSTNDEVQIDRFWDLMEDNF